MIWKHRKEYDKKLKERGICVKCARKKVRPNRVLCFGYAVKASNRYHNAKLTFLEDI